MSDIEITLRVNKAVERAIEKKKINNIPIVVYDSKTKSICKVESDGTRTVIGQRITKGRYSEQNK